MKLKILVCGEVERASTPIPISRHIVAPIAVCREMEGKDLRIDTLPAEIVDAVRRNGYVVLDDPDYVMKALGVRLNENEYMKILIEEHVLA